MASRLMPIGFTPHEARRLGQAAYLPTERIEPGTPIPLRPRPEASHLINQAIKALSQNPFGPHAHLGRVVLWETIFGAGTWHEQIDYTAEDWEYMAAFEEALLGDLPPLPSTGTARNPETSPHAVNDGPNATIGSVSAPAGVQAPLKRGASQSVPPASVAPQLPSHNKGRPLFIFVGICAILFGGLAVIEAVSLLLGLDSDATQDDALGGLLFMPAAFGMLSIGGAAASGINTRVSKIMMLVACFFMILASLVFLSTGYASLMDGSVLIGLTTGMAICTIVSMAQSSRTNAEV